jgi:hypothetical protein
MLVLEGISTPGADFVACLKGFDIIPGDWDIKSPSLEPLGFIQQGGL